MTRNWMRAAGLVLAAVGLLAGANPAKAGYLIAPSASDTVVSTGVDDQVFGSFNLGFTFNFFGSGGYTQVSISSNGNLQFGTTDYAYTNAGFPYATPMIAPFWDDLYLPPGSIRYNNSTAGQFVAIWDGVKHYDGFGSSAGNSPISFEAILLGAGNSFGLADGSIIFSYDNVTSGNTPTVGLNSGSDAATLSGILGSSSDGTLTDAQAQSLTGHNYLFTPDGSGDYTVSEYTDSPTAAPAPPGVLLALSGILSLGGFSWLRRRRLTAAA